MDYFSEEFNSINSKFTKFIDENKHIKNENIVLQAKITDLESNIIKLNQECENYSKVSVVKNLHNQIFEKDNFIKLLERKINKLTNESNLKLEIKHHNSDEDEEVADAEEEEVELADAEEAEADVELADAEEAEADAEEEAEADDKVEDDDKVEEEVDDEDEVDNKVEDEVDDKIEEEVEEVEEVDFIEKKLKPPNCKSRKLKLYLITDDEYKEI